MSFPSWRTVSVASTGAISTGVGGNSRDIVVPTDRMYQIYSLRATILASSDAGTRIMAVEILDGSSNELWEHRSAVTVASTTVTMVYNYAPENTELVAARDTDFVSIPIPNFWLPEAYIIRVRDHANISSSDDIEVRAIFGISGHVIS